MPPLLSKEEMYEINYDDEAHYEILSTQMLEDNIDGSQSHLNVNRR